ncbi:MAG: D-aminoacyl-tRNA deacylase [Candidatus Omnitrophica bacterium]|nr:D-aminoacyl-tRNA deacylase [Candidatus Omnitrophota bacterium]MCM8799350.1 D-aminoacyl-tRNA deacylase [Candidatus Omnitrophota bacterium]
MRAVIQRVTEAKVLEKNRQIAEIKNGLVVLVAIAKDDTAKDVVFLANKLKDIRIFDDEKGKLNLSIEEVKGEILLISNFTLLGKVFRGKRPDFTEAESFEKAKELYDYLLTTLKSIGLPIKSANFGKDMQVHLINDGPVTIILDTKGDL